ALLQELQAWDSAFANLLAANVDKQPEFLASKDALKKYLGAELTKAIRPVFAGTTAEVGKAHHGIETARAVVADAKAELEVRLRQAMADLEELRRSIDQVKPWSQSRLDDFYNQLKIALDRASRHVESTIVDARC